MNLTDYLYLTLLLCFACCTCEFTKPESKDEILERHKRVIPFLQSAGCGVSFIFMVLRQCGMCEVRLQIKDMDSNFFYSIKCEICGGRFAISVLEPVFLQMEQSTL